MIVASVLDDSITDSIHASKLGPIIRMTSASAIAATVAGSGSKVCASPFAGTIEVTSACSPPTRAAQSARIENEATTRSELPWAAAPRVRVAHGAASVRVAAWANPLRERRLVVRLEDNVMRGESLMAARVGIS